MRNMQVTVRLRDLLVFVAEKSGSITHQPLNPVSVDLSEDKWDVIVQICLSVKDSFDRGRSTAVNACRQRVRQCKKVNAALTFVL